MANVTLLENPKGLLQRLAFSYSRKRFGKVVDPVRAAGNHNGLLIASGLLETASEKGWKKLDPHLRWLANQATASSIGCSWCTDFGYFEGLQEGVDPRKVRDVAQWRQSSVYNEKERLVLEFAEGVNATPSHVSDEVVAKLSEHFSDQEILELGAWIALENYRSRFNAAMGLHSEGFSEDCKVPEDLATLHKSEALSG
jgi:alkylhydroperoxidase family enzyme